MYRARLLELIRRIDPKRLAYAEIAGGLLYLIGFNTVLYEIDIWYFGFIVLVPVVSLPFIITAPAETDRVSKTVLMEPKLLCGVVKRPTSPQTAKQAMATPSCVVSPPNDTHEAVSPTCPRY